MGMDVFGRNPTAKEGEYFRNNIWYWRPLANLCQSGAPKICAGCEHWQSNDGDGLDAEAALALAAVLEGLLADGTIARMVADRDRYLAGLPDETCELCDGKGVRTDEIAVNAGMDKQVITEEGHPRCGQTGWCNSCDGRGTKRPFLTHYPCDVENVAEFAAFLKSCGGFSIC